MNCWCGPFCYGQCHFDYCCSSWFSSLSAKWKHKLQVLQNKIIRFILRLEPRSHIGSDEFEKLGMLKVEDRIKQLKLNHVFKIYHDEAPEYLISNFRKFSNIHRYSTRGSATNFILPKVNVYACNKFSSLVLRNEIHYLIMSRHQKPTCNS